MKIKPPAPEPAIRMIMQPRYTNPYGDIFGGFILSMIDEAAAVEAQRQAIRRYVTVAMDAVQFHKPVHVGDIVSLWTRTEHIGRTSIRVHVNVHARAFEGGQERNVTEADVTLVAIDAHGRPKPIVSKD